MSFALNAKKGNRDDGESETFVTHSLTSEGHDASEDGTGRGTPIVAAPLTKGSATGGGAKGLSETDDLAPGTGTGGTVGIATAIGVRRLTPTECERLQGFPDGWTQLGDTADSRRYSALGDAVTVPVAEWIGGRLARVTSEERTTA